MNIKFIGQGLDPASDLTAGNLIIDSLIDEEFNTFNAFVAFVSTGGINNIIDQLTSFKARGGTIRLYIGVDLNGTSKEALEKLIELEIESYIVFSPNNIIYHPKIYAFEGNTLSRAIIGSSNLTVRGFFQSIEASVCIDCKNEDEKGSNFIADIYEHFNSIINLEHQSCQRLTPEILTLLVENKVVLPEAINRAKSNKINQEFGQKDRTKNKELLEIFRKIKQKRPPKGFKKVVRKEELTVEPDENVNVVYEDTLLVTGAMWIETGKMTGGSRNILDLSKSGKQDGVVKPGSVSFFGVDPNNTAVRKHIDIHLGGKIYIENPIFFAEKNSNWRIQLKGETVDDEKLTTISKPHLGLNGGFVDKILLFTQIDNTNFKLEILDPDDMEKLIENSSDWAKGGRGGRGRAYGFI
jgi:HKD family nuclease